MAQPRTLTIERQAGERATFVVYYSRTTRKGTKQYLDGLFSPTAEQARADFEAMAAELGWKVEVERVEERVG